MSNNIPYVPGDKKEYMTVKISTIYCIDKL